MKFNKYLYNNISKNFGLTLLELIITITITSIILAGTASFIATAINLMNETTTLKTTNNNTQVILNILTNDLLANQGNINTITTTNNDNLVLDIIEPNNINNTKTVTYSCDYTTNKFYRRIDFIPEILLNNISKCTFTSVISHNLLNITIFIKITLQQEKGSEIYEVINAPYNI